MSSHFEQTPAVTDKGIPAPMPEEEPTPARVEAFSDGVFAIIITLLALDLRVPRASVVQNGSLAAALLHQWPVYVAFVLSFLQVGVVWANHHAMFHYFRRTDHKVLIYNLLLLMCVTVLPFTTSLLAEYARAPEVERRTAALVYSGVLVISGVFFDALWNHALHADLVKPHADPHRLYWLRRHWLLLPIFYGIAFALAFVSARVSMVMYALLLIYYALPGPVVLRWMTARRAHDAAKA
jgi:uncharacterized membrane protein